MNISPHERPLMGFPLNLSRVDKWTRARGGVCVCAHRFYSSKACGRMARRAVKIDSLSLPQDFDLMGPGWDLRKHFSCPQEMLVAASPQVTFWVTPFKRTGILKGQMLMSLVKAFNNIIKNSPAYSAWGPGVLLPNLLYPSPNTFLSSPFDIPGCRSLGPWNITFCWIHYCIVEQCGHTPSYPCKTNSRKLPSGTRRSEEVPGT